MTVDDLLIAAGMTWDRFAITRDKDPLNFVNRIGWRGSYRGIEHGSFMDLHHDASERDEAYALETIHMHAK